MPLPLKDRKIASIDYIIKRIKGSQSYDSMKDHNEKGSEVMIAREDAEQDYKIGMSQAVSELMDAFHAKDSTSAEKALKAFISMLLDAHEDEKKLEQQYVDNSKT